MRGIVLLCVVLVGCERLKYPEVTAVDGGLPEWVTHVWRDDINGITCWSNGSVGLYAVATCFRDAVQCPGSTSND